MTGTRTRERVVRTQVEPRLQERRQAVRDEARIRRRRGLAVVAVVAGVVGALVAAVFSPLLDVDEVRVAGADRLDAAELVAASGIEVGDRMISLELDQARDALRGLPGVRSARVEREWPSVVRTTITESDLTFQFQALETTALTLALQHNITSASTASGNTTMEASPGRLVLARAFILDLFDKDDPSIQYRYVIPRGEIGERSEFAHSNADITGYTFNVEVIGSYQIITNDPAAEVEDDDPGD